MSADTPKYDSIEQKIQRIQVILTQLQSGSLPLDDMVSMYEEGITLSKKAKTQLEKAKVRIRKVTDDASEEMNDWMNEIVQEISGRLEQAPNKEELIKNLCARINSTPC